MCVCLRSVMAHWSHTYVCTIFTSRCAVTDIRHIQMSSYVSMYIHCYRQNTHTMSAYVSMYAYMRLMPLTAHPSQMCTYGFIWMYDMYELIYIYVHVLYLWNRHVCLRCAHIDVYGCTTCMSWYRCIWMYCMYATDILVGIWVYIDVRHVWADMDIHGRAVCMKHTYPSAYGCCTSICRHDSFVSPLIDVSHHSFVSVTWLPICEAPRMRTQYVPHPCRMRLVLRMHE